MKHADLSSETPVESEADLVARAQEAVSQCYWVVGECAAQWTRRYSRGRTDADFGALVGMSADQIFQRRRVWETFGSVRDQFSQLKWSHFYAALPWEDAEVCLRWAEELQATVAEMKAWRRAQHGEDLTVESPEEDELTSIGAPWETVPVQDPAEFGRSTGAVRGPADAAGELNPALVGVARQLEPGDSGYAPFRQGAAQPAATGTEAQAGPAAGMPPSTHQLVKRMTSTIERCVKVLTPEFAREYRTLPEPVRHRLIDVVEELSRALAQIEA